MSNGDSAEWKLGWIEFGISYFASKLNSKEYWEDEIMKKKLRRIQSSDNIQIQENCLKKMEIYKFLEKDKIFNNNY